MIIRAITFIKNTNKQNNNNNNKRLGKARRREKETELSFHLTPISQEAIEFSLEHIKLIEFVFVFVFVF